MKLETFFENFEMLTDAPNAVVNLREIILQLSVMGKLISQDANDGLASILLEKIKFQKEQLVKEKKIKKFKSVLPLEKHEIPFKIPSTWIWSKLDNICINITDGFHSTPKPTDSGIPYLTAQHIKPNFLDFKNCLYISEKDHNELVSKTRPSKGDILVVNIGAGCGIPAIIDVDFEFSFKNVAIFKRSSGINSEFLYYFLLHQREVIFEKLTQGGAQPFLSLNKLRNIPVPLPPLAEQKRIVEKCDRLLSICDEIEKRQQQRQESIVRMNESAIAQLLSSQNPDDFRQHWQRIFNNFDLLYSIPETIPKLRQAILQLALQGKLVRQDPNDEPASSLLKKIQIEREKLLKQKKLNKSDFSLQIEIDETFTDLPNGWVWCSLAELSGWIVDGTHHTPTYVEQGVPFISAKNIINGQISFDGCRMITEEEYEKLIQRCNPKKDDILVTKSGSIGRVAIVKTEQQFTLFESVALIPLIKNYLSFDYIAHVVYLNSSGEFGRANQKGVAVRHLHLKEIKQIPIPLPPLAEQKRIVEKCDRLMSLCDTLEAKLKQGQESSEKLMEVAARKVLTA